MNNAVNIFLQHQASKISEGDLLIGLREGKKSSYRQLFEECNGVVFGTALRLLKDVSEAEDVSQETFLKVFRSIDQFKGNSSLQTWIMKIAVNLCLDKLKSLEFKHREASEVIDETTLMTKSGVKRPNNTGLIDTAINMLPLNTKTVFVLRAIQGFKHEEIAYLMNISVGTSKSQYSHAKTLLRKKLEPFREVLFDEL